MRSEKRFWCATSTKFLAGYASPSARASRRDAFWRNWRRSGEDLIVSIGRVLGCSESYRRYPGDVLHFTGTEPSNDEVQVWKNRGGSTTTGSFAPHDPGTGEEVAYDDVARSSRYSLAAMRRRATASGG